MKNKFIFIMFIAFIAVITFSFASCGSGGGKTLNSAEALKEYLDRQPANTPEKPIKVTLSANAPMLEKITAAITASGKYVNLNLSGNALTTIPKNAFYDESTGKACDMLVAITIPGSVTSIEEYTFYGHTSLANVTMPNGVTSIGYMAFVDCTSLANVTIGNSVTSIGGFAFEGCKNLTSVTFQGTIPSSGFVDNEIFGSSGDNGYIGDLSNKYLAGGAGTYKRASGSTTWTKQ